eukprot:1193655-Prorocentrum_minimum.AAC.2
MLLSPAQHIWPTRVQSSSVVLGFYLRGSKSRGALTCTEGAISICPAGSCKAGLEEDRDKALQHTANCIAPVTQCKVGIFMSTLSRRRSPMAEEVMRSFGAGVECAGDKSFLSQNQDYKPCDVAVVFDVTSVARTSSFMQSYCDFLRARIAGSITPRNVSTPATAAIPASRARTGRFGFALRKEPFQILRATLRQHEAPIPQRRGTKLRAPDAPAGVPVPLGQPIHRAERPTR